MGRINKKKLIDSARESSSAVESVKNGALCEDDETTRKPSASPMSSENDRNGKLSSISNELEDASINDENASTPLLMTKKRKFPVSNTPEIPLSAENDDDDDSDYDYVAISPKKSRKTSKKSKKSAKSGSRKSNNHNKKSEKEATLSNEEKLNDQFRSETDNGNGGGNANEGEQNEKVVEEEEYEVEAIVGLKIEEGRKMYRVRWKGYTEEDDTWEDESKINCPDLVKKFNEQNLTQKSYDGVGTSLKKSKKKNAKSSSVQKKKKVNNKKSQPATVAADDPNKQWEVLKIVASCEENGIRLFRIRWKGFNAKDDTWEPESNLSCKDLIQKHMRSLQEQEHVDTKQLREKPTQTRRLVNETIPRTNYSNKIERTSKRAGARNRIFYGDMDE